ncbi:hypothetical protein MHYP_G00148600 [Metynnis hypsauchen]
MKRQGEIYDFFVKRSKSGTDQAKTEINPGISSPDSFHPGTSQESQCQIQPSPPSPASLRGDTETSASDQGEDDPEPRDATDLYPAVSSTTFAPPKGPSDISRSKDESPVQPCLTKFPRTQHGTRMRAFSSTWYKENSWLEYSSSTLDLARAVELVGALTDTFQDYRNEKYFGELWKEVEELAEQCKIGVQIQYKRHPRISSRFLHSLVMSTVGQRNCDDEGFSRALFYQVIDCLITELKRCFSKKSCEIMKGVQSLNPKSATFLNEEPLCAFAQTYESDLSDLKHEVHQTKRLLDRRVKSGLDRPSTLLEFIVFLEPYKEVFHEIFRLCKIAVVTPVSTASCERSFSALKLIKTHLRTTMADDRLSHLGTLSVESRRALNIDDYVKHFSASHHNQRIMLF